MIEINNIASTVGIGFLNWGVYDLVDRKGTKGGLLKLAIAVAAVAVRIGMNPQPLEISTRDLQILCGMTAFSSIVSAIRAGHPGQAVLKLGVAMGAMAGLQLTVFPQEEVIHNVLTLTKYGNYVATAILSIWGAKQLFQGYRRDDVDLLKGGIQCALLAIPTATIPFGIEKLGY